MNLFDDTHGSDHDCEKDGHKWMVGDDRCVFCGMPWSEVYDIDVTPNPDGSVQTHVRRVEDRP